jgi:hypothetical protein
MKLLETADPQVTQDSDTFAATVVAGDRVELATSVSGLTWGCTRLDTTNDAVSGTAPLLQTRTGVRVRGTNLQVHYIVVIGR